LTRDSDREVSIRATLELYRLGDYNESASKRIIELFETSLTDIQDPSPSILALQKLLDEISRKKDPRFDSLLRKIWEAQKAKELTQSHFVDIAKHLEESGQKLPQTYWMTRSQENKDVVALEFLITKSNPEIIRYFQDAFQSPSSILKSYAASFLYAQDPQASYWNYLDQSVSQGLQNGFSNEMEAKVTLQAFIRADFRKAMPLIKTALNSEDEIIRISTHQALSKIKNSTTTDLLFQSAVNQLKKSSFPESELRALVSQNTNYSDLKYEEVRRLATQPPQEYQVNGSWSPNDFAALDFEKIHRK
jgi:hypothetical protein